MTVWFPPFEGLKVRLVGVTVATLVSEIATVIVTSPRAGDLNPTLAWRVRGF
jgi:hypothetical protein